ncbi:GntR family transcriptional regulator [Leucobacter sp. BZR 635]
MLIRIDEASERAIYAQIADSVRADIASGKLRQGATLPAAKRLGEALDINVHTVLRAYQQLRDERLIDLRRGRGAVVTALAGTLVELSGEVRALVDRANSLGVSQETVAAMVAHLGPAGPPPAGNEPIPLRAIQEEAAA